MTKLDLHRAKHQDVDRTVIRFIEDHWGRDTEAHIITGNSKRMRDIVIGILNEYQLSYTIGNGLDVNNTGYIICTI